METAGHNEQLLIQGLKNHSRKAFDEIYRIYAKRLFAYCKQYTKRTEDAEEIVQDVFVRLWNSRTIIRQEDSLRSLLFIMSKHSLINAYRANLNSLVYEDYVDYQAELVVDDIANMFEYDEFIRELKRALGTLPATQRKVIELSRLQELSNKEIAQELSLSEQTVKNQLSLGLKALRSELKRFPAILFLLSILN